MCDDLFNKPDLLRKKARRAELYQIHKVRELERCRKYRENNPDKVKQTQRKYLNNNREKRAKVIRNYINKRSAIDPQFRLLRGLRSRLRRALSMEAKRGSAVDLLGCSGSFLKSYIEFQFSDGMNWENYGFRGWHIDHKIPLSLFDLTNPDELAKACHYSNLQPLWWRDNMTKGNKNVTRLSHRPTSWEISLGQPCGSAG